MRKKYDFTNSKKNPRETAEYINAALEEKDLNILLLALRNVTEAHVA